jgi:purine-nucleoside phosphorylase
MSLHINAKAGDIAETILLPGDPLRAKFIAENILQDSKCYSEVRGMYGFTGSYKGKKVSVQGTGMGLPSISIYANELIDNYNVKNLIRVGTCGSMHVDITLGHVILAMSSCSESNFNRRVFRDMDFAPTANFDLLQKAHSYAKDKIKNLHIGSVLSADKFYNEDSEEWKLWAKYGVLGVEMETSALYTIAAKKQCKALSILTVSDCLVTGEVSSSMERQESFMSMVEIALNAAL